MPPSDEGGGKTAGFVGGRDNAVKSEEVRCSCGTDWLEGAAAPDLALPLGELSAEPTERAKRASKKL